MKTASGFLKFGAALFMLALVVGCTGRVTESAPTELGGSPWLSPPGAGATVQVQSPDVSAPVDWGNGRDVPGMDQGIPNPPGWYDHAFGGPTERKVIYLTFDDGPQVPYTGQVLDLLARYGSLATFFVTGSQVQSQPDIVPRIMRGGHAVGDHTQHHADLVALSEDRVRSELADVQSEVGAALGACMRPPYGLIDAKVARISSSLGLIPILWTGHASDWDRPPADRIVDDLRRATKPGAVLLLHDGGGDRSTTVAAVARLLPWWRERGYALESVPACRSSLSGG